MGTTDTALPEDMGAWGVRLAMASRGWISRTRLKSGSDGIFFFQVWFERWDWHGRGCNNVVLHSGAQVRPDAPSEAVPAMGSAVLRAALRALDAWARFPDSVPRQTPEGELTEEPVATRIIFREGFWKTPDVFPTEALPADIAPFLDADLGEEPVPAAALAFAADGFDYNDVLTYMTRTSARRFVARDWSLNHEASTSRWHGERVRPHYFPFSVAAPLPETLTADALDGALAALMRLRERYRPGGPHGALPPGVETSATAAVREEKEARAKDIARLAERPCDGYDLFRVVDAWRLRMEQPWGGGALKDRFRDPTVEEVRALVLAAGGTVLADGLPGEGAAPGQ